MNPVATGTGNAAMAQALGIVLQMTVFYTTGLGITNEQSGALAVLLYPIVHWYLEVRLGIYYTAKMNGHGDKPEAKS